MTSDDNFKMRDSIKFVSSVRYSTLYLRPSRGESREPTRFTNFTYDDTFQHKQRENEGELVEFPINGFKYSLRHVFSRT